MTWQDRDRYNVERILVRRLNCLAEVLLQGLVARESSTAVDSVWMAGYRAAVQDLINCLGEDYLPGAYELGLAALGGSAALCLERLREKSPRGRKKAKVGE